MARAQVLVGAGMLAYACGEYDDAIQWFEEARPILERHGDVQTLSFAWLMRGSVAEHLGDEDTTEACFVSGLAIAREIGDTRLLGEILPSLSDAAFRRGDLGAAERHGLEAHTYLRSSGDVFMECMNLGNLAQIALARGDTLRAAIVFAEGLDLAEASSSQWNIANLIACAAAIAVVLGDADHAARLLGAGDAVLEASGHPRMPHFGLHAETTDRVQTMIGEDAFAAAWAHGRALPVAEAMQAARAVYAAAHPA